MTSPPSSVGNVKSGAGRPSSTGKRSTSKRRDVGVVRVSRVAAAAGGSQVRRSGPKLARRASGKAARVSLTPSPAVDRRRVDGPIPPRCPRSPIEGRKARRDRPCAVVAAAHDAPRYPFVQWRQAFRSGTWWVTTRATGPAGAVSGTVPCAWRSVNRPKRVLAGRASTGHALIGWRGNRLPLPPSPTCRMRTRRLLPKETE